MFACPVSTIVYLGELADWVEEEAQRCESLVRQGEKYVLVPAEAFEQLTTALRKVMLPTPQQLEDSVCQEPLSELLVQVIESTSRNLPLDDASL